MHTEETCSCAAETVVPIETARAMAHEDDAAEAPAPTDTAQAIPPDSAAQAAADAVAAAAVTSILREARDAYWSSVLSTAGIEPEDA